MTTTPPAHAPPRRRTHRRSDAGAIRLTSRDVAVMTWIAEQEAVCSALLPLLLGCAAPTARHWPARMRRAGFLQGAVIYGMAWYWPTAAGMRMVGATWPARRPAATYLEHIHALGALRLWIATASPHARWIAERVLRARAATEGDSRGIPDAEVWDVEGTITAVEVELHAKPSETLAATIVDRLERYARVLYACSHGVDASVHRACVRLAGHHPHLTPLDRVEVIPIRTILADIAPRGPFLADLTPLPPLPPAR